MSDFWGLCSFFQNKVSSVFWNLRLPFRAATRFEEWAWLPCSLHFWFFFPFANERRVLTSVKKIVAREQRTTSDLCNPWTGSTVWVITSLQLAPLWKYSLSIWRSNTHFAPRYLMHIWLPELTRYRYWTAWIENISLSWTFKAFIWTKDFCRVMGQFQHWVSAQKRISSETGQIFFFLGFPF